MALAEQRYARSDDAVREPGYRAWVQALGVADALRFVELIHMGQGDSLDGQDQVLGDAAVEELYERAEAYWEDQVEAG